MNARHATLLLGPFAKLSMSRHRGHRVQFRLRRLTFMLFGHTRAPGDEIAPMPPDRDRFTVGSL